MISKSQLPSLIARFLFIIFFSTILGYFTYSKLDLIFTTIYIATMSFILFFPPTYDFFTK
jgi:hypothetical protein